MIIDVVKLIAELSDDESEETEVLAEIDSITQREFFEAEQAGIRPEFKAVIWQDEYGNEAIIEFGGKKLDIYRTYSRSDGKLELYAQSRVGVV